MSSRCFPLASDPPCFPSPLFVVCRRKVNEGTNTYVATTIWASFPSSSTSRSEVFISSLRRATAVLAICSSFDFTISTQPDQRLFAPVTESYSCGSQRASSREHRSELPQARWPAPTRYSPISSLQAVEEVLLLLAEVAPLPYKAAHFLSSQNTAAAARQTSREHLKNATLAQTRETMVIEGEFAPAHPAVAEEEEEALRHAFTHRDNRKILLRIVCTGDVYAASILACLGGNLGRSFCELSSNEASANWCTYLVMKLWNVLEESDRGLNQSSVWWGANLLQMNK